jgi:hypothetical protein
MQYKRIAEKIIYKIIIRLYFRKKDFILYCLQSPDSPNIHYKNFLTNLIHHLLTCYLYKRG